MNRFARTAATAVMSGALALAGLGLGAGTATADTLSGTYTLFSDHSQRKLNGIPTPYHNSSSVWTITPCGDGCARVVSAAGWSANAHLNNGRWEFTREGMWSCPDGRNLPNAIGYSIDAATLRGTSTGTIPVGCEGFPVFADGITVSLTRV
ncbi:hypothetical protein [Mycobacterium deserti]|uniref:Secreted protein n=1 Tax=Mycobacterium deserti TaxID=2978347 RepID=A0ABT2MJW2_9MYCO|nr:hypothetical protein [Mycobacterium deserti]MCT7661380.1 hypothetical protein [Mycobacterium deserti]